MFVSVCAAPKSSPTMPKILVRFFSVLFWFCAHDVAHVCGDPLSRYKCRATRDATEFLRILGFFLSGNPKPHPSKPHPCNMPQAKTEVTLQFLESRAAEVALQHSLFCMCGSHFTKSCTTASEKLECNIEKAALQESGAFLPLSCGFQAPTFRLPRLGHADCQM